jgi:predicted transcriptional regulator
LPTASEFDAWMQRNGLSLATAATTLGMTRRMIAHYRTGSRPIPKVVGMACKWLERERRA